MCFAIWDGPLRCGNMCLRVLACFCFFVMERMVPNGKNIKNLKLSKFKFIWFLYKVIFSCFLEDEFYSFIEKYFRFWIFVYNTRVAFSVTAMSGMELFALIFNGWKTLTSFAMGSVSDVAVVVNVSLHIF